MFSREHGLNTAIRRNSEAHTKSIKHMNSMNRMGEEGHMGCGGLGEEVIFDIRSLDVNVGQVQKNRPN